MKNGKAMSMSYKTQAAMKYREDFANYVANEVMKQNWDLIPNRWQHFYVDTVFYFEKTHQDCNNYFKVMLDAITDTKKIWLDDDVVCERVQRIYYDSANPRVEIIIRPVNYIGVFDSEEHLDNFVSRCVECTRYKSNCSILRKAKEGRTQEEIQDGTCAKFRRVKGDSKHGKEE